MRSLQILGVSLLMFLVGWTGAVAKTQVISLTDETPSLTLLETRGDTLRFRVSVGRILATPLSTREGDFARLAIPGFHLSRRIGEPELPMMNRLVEIPCGAQPRVEIELIRTREIDLSATGIEAPVMPAQPSVPKSADPAALPFHYQRSAYLKDRDFGAEWVKVVDLGRLRAMRVGRCEVAPLRYNPVRHTLTVVEEMVFRLSFPGADQATGDRLKALTRSPFFAPVYEQVAGYRGLHDDYPDHVRDLVTMVIVTPPEFELQLADFVDWKTERGFVTILAVTGTPEVGTTKEQIRDYIHGLYNNATPEQPAPSFVLFVGDVAQMPTWTEGYNVTDRPYCDVEGDLVPDIYYGRFSATNPTMLQDILDKSLMYDRYEMPDPSYLHEVVMIAGMDAGHGQVWGNGQINYGTTYYFNADHDIYSHTYLYPESGSNAGNIIQNVSDGVSYINYTAHGSSTSWGNPYFGQSDVNNLQNYGKYCLAVGNCCTTSDYSVGECFAETWLRASGKGAIGYIGGSDSTYWDEDYWWGVGAGSVVEHPTYETHGLGAYDGVFHDHGEAMTQWYVTNDAIIFSGNLAVMEAGGMYSYYWTIYNLMGDPSISTWIGTPQTNPVSHDAMIPMDATSLTVSADPGSYVGLSRDGELVGAGTIGQSGTAEIAVWNLGSPGEAQIVVMCQNCVPYVSIVGIGYVEQPVCVVNPQFFEVTLPSGGMIVHHLSIGNEGEPGSVLDYSLEIDDPILPDRSIDGSTMTPMPGDYMPGTTRTYTLTVYNASGDYEWLDQITLNCFTGITVIGATDFVGGSGGDLVYNGATGEGAHVYWHDTNGGWGNVYGGESVTAQITLSFSVDLADQLEIPWTMSGDDYGSPPHDIVGKLILSGPTEPVIMLIAPDGGEIWPVGEPRDVLWSSAGGVSAVDIELSRDAGETWETLASGHDDTGSFTWIVSEPLAALCLVRLSDTGSEAADESAGVFYIHQPVTWLNLPISEGQCEVGEYDLLDVVFDATDLVLGDYFANIVVHSNAGPDLIVPVTLHVNGATAVGQAPAKLRLERNWPNPFNPRTRIAFELPAAGAVELAVYDSSGRLLRCLVSGTLAAGRHVITWDGCDDAGRAMASGLYLYRLSAGGQRLTEKMLLLK